MTIPGNLAAPLFAFDVESGGQFEQIAPIVLYGHKTDDGTATVNVKTPCASRAQARALAGKGSMLEQMVAIVRRNAPTHPLNIVAVPAVGTAEVRTITVAAPDAAGGVGVVSIMGEAVSVDIPAGSTAAATATLLAAAINAYDNAQTGMALPFTATAAAAVVTLTARHDGAYAAEIDIFEPVLDGANAFAGKLTHATTTPGAGAPDTSAANAAINEQDWSFLISAFGDAANVGRYADLLGEVAGRWGYANQRFGHAYYPKRDTSSNLLTYGESQDDWHLTAIPTFSTGGFAQPGFLWVAGVAARVAPWLASGANGDVSRNQTGLAVAGLTAPRDQTFWPDLATREAFIKAGLSSWSVSGNGDVMIDKLVTHHRTTAGVPDTTFRDVQRPHQLMYSMRFMLARLKTEHANKAISDDNPANLAAISTPEDVEATVVHAYRELTRRGVLENAQLAVEQISVVRDLDNANRLNVTVPKDFTNPLDIMAGLARVYSQFRT